MATMKRDQGRRRGGRANEGRTPPNKRPARNEFTGSGRSATRYDDRDGERSGRFRHAQDLKGKSAKLASRPYH